jgi:hypothetical protein
MSVSTILINKMAAASRQLNAAIRMFFVKEDELAIHTVASMQSPRFWSIRPS